MIYDGCNCDNAGIIGKWMKYGNQTYYKPTKEKVYKMVVVVNTKGIIGINDLPTEPKIKNIIVYTWDSNEYVVSVDKLDDFLISFPIGGEAERVLYGD